MDGETCDKADLVDDVDDPDGDTEVIGWKAVNAKYASYPKTLKEILERTNEKVAGSPFKLERNHVFANECLWVLWFPKVWSIQWSRHHRHPSLWFSWDAPRALASTLPMLPSNVFDKTN